MDAIKGAMVQTISIIGVSVFNRERVPNDAELSRALADVLGITNYRWIANDETGVTFFRSNGHRGPELLCT